MAHKTNSQGCLTAGKADTSYLFYMSNNQKMQATSLQEFQNSQFGTVRTVQVDNQPYFVGRDVAIALGYAKPENALSQHVDNEDTLKQGIPDRQGFIQKTTLINESGLYALVFGSKLPAAKQFKRWVTSEVLPTIRRTGGYGVEQGWPSDMQVIRAAARIAGGQAALSRFLGIGESTISEVVNGCGRPSGDMVRFVVETCRRIVALGATDGVQVCRPESICRLPRYRMNRLTPNRMIHLLTLAHRIEDERLRLELVRELTEGGAR